MKFMRHFWLFDCESLVARLNNPKNERLENVRLSSDIQGLKQMLWGKFDGTVLDGRGPADIAENTVPWIDTSCKGRLLDEEDETDSDAEAHEIRKFRAEGDRS